MKINPKFTDKLKFDKDGLIPVITTDCNTGDVLMMAYANRESLEKSADTGKMHYWSRSRGNLWMKGETSGHFQDIVSIRTDCDCDTLLVSVKQTGCACHTGSYSCFFNELTGGNDDACTCTAEAAGHKADDNINDIGHILAELYCVVKDRQLNPKEGSYTNYLLDKGLDKILKKVGEETSEVIIASKNRAADEIKYEIADLLYHLIVLMVERGITLNDIHDELKSRRH